MSDRQIEKHLAAGGADEHQLTGALSITDAWPAHPTAATQQHAPQTEQTQAKPYDHMAYPAMDAWAVRASWLGLSGKLFPDMNRVRQTMLQSGPLGEAAVARMDALQAAGWKFGPQSISDAYLRETVPNPFSRAIKGLFVGGGYHDPKYGKVAFNPVNSALKSIFGMEPSADREAARIFQHELTHGKYDAGWMAYEADPAARARFRSLETAQAPTRSDLQRLGLSDTVPLIKAEHGQEMVREEMRALSSESLASTRLAESGMLRRWLPQSTGSSNAWVRLGLDNENLGSTIKRTWHYEGYSAITPKEANAVSSEYNRSFTGGLYVDGKINPAAEEQLAKEIRALPIKPPEVNAATGAMASVQADSAMARFFSNPDNRQFLSRGGQAIGALGLAYSLSDIGNAFSHSPGTGVGRLADIATSYAGYEGGMAVGMFAAETGAELLGRRMPLLGQLGVPLISLLGGVIGAQIAHDRLGQSLETRIATAIDDKHKLEKQGSV